MIDAGDCGIFKKSAADASLVSILESLLTGVKSRSESASLADVAASIRSSQREPVAEATFGGSAEKALRPSRLILLEYSFDFVLSCFGLRAFWVTDGFRGLGL